MREFKDLKVGDKIKIIDEKVGSDWDINGAMDKYLGKIVTVSIAWLNYIEIKEDEGKCWSWYPPMIDLSWDPNEESSSIFAMYGRGKVYKKTYSSYESCKKQCETMLVEFPNDTFSIMSVEETVSLKPTWERRKDG